MIKDAATLMKENYHKLGNLTDAQFIATKSKVCSRRMIHAEQIGRVARLNGFGIEEQIKLSDIKIGDTVKINATVRSMNVNGGEEKTGVITLEDIQDVDIDESIGMLFLDTEKCLFTTIECENEWWILNEVIRQADNWVNLHSLSEMIGPDSFLTDFKEERSRQQGRGMDLDFSDLGFDDRTNDGPSFSDLLF